MAAATLYGSVECRAGAVKHHAAPLRRHVVGVHRAQACRQVEAHASRPANLRAGTARTSGSAADVGVASLNILEGATGRVRRVGRNQSRRSASRIVLRRSQSVVDVAGHALASSGIAGFGVIDGIVLVDQRLDSGHAGRGDGSSADEARVRNRVLPVGGGELARAFTAEQCGIVSVRRVQCEVWSQAVWHARDQRLGLNHRPKYYCTGRSCSSSRRCSERHGGGYGAVEALAGRHSSTLRTEGEVNRRQASARCYRTAADVGRGSCCGGCCACAAAKRHRGRGGGVTAAGVGERDARDPIAACDGNAAARARQIAGVGRIRRRRKDR